jgi:peptide-methionine (S)-S-oxide reductase
VRLVKNRGALKPPRAFGRNEGMLRFALPLALLLVACGAPQKSAEPAPTSVPATAAAALYAGGCFWCAEHDFEKIPGVYEAVSGYTGGDLANPTYENHEGHYEAVQVFYDPAQISYRELTDRFWRLVDPTDAGGQFCDRGPSYRTAVFATPEQQTQAAASKAAAETALGQPIVTPIEPAKTFWTAEEYHQDYADKNPLRYRYYRSSCGRDGRISEVWGAAAGK